jgi:hypothetical protein
MPKRTVEAPRSTAAPPSRRATPDAIEAVLASVWRSTLPQTRKRFALLASFAESLRAGNASPAARVEAAETAHKLAGSLGTFGFPNGTALARELEVLFDSDADLDPAQVTALTRQLHRAVPPASA